MADTEEIKINMEQRNTFKMFEPSKVVIWFSNAKF